MSDSLSPSTAGPRRLWLPVILVALMVACVALPFTVEFENVEMMFGILFLGPAAATAGVALWWLFLSGLPWRDRLLGLLVVAIASGAAYGLSHESFRLALTIYGLAGLSLVWVGYLLLTTWLNWPVRRIGLALTLFLAAAGCTLLRMDGTWGNFVLQINYRFAESAEDRYVKGRTAESDSPVAAAGPVTLAAGDWPAFRGAARDGRLAGVSIPTDWDKSQPKLLWKQPIGPGWSSFTVVGSRVYTQEQRGPQEVVVCLDADTGKQLWSHADEARFTEAVAGAGPRATPTFHDGKVYALGATGKLNCLDAGTGKLVWVKDMAADSGAKPQAGGWWGFCSSPLVANGLVVVVSSYTDGKAVVAYAADTGALAWSGGKGHHTYCSAQLSILGGVEQILVTTDHGLTAYDPKSGQELWDHEWVPMKDMARVVQPAVVSDTDVLLGNGFKQGTRRLKVSQASAGWSVEEVWTTKAINPYYNDLVVHKGHLYGFDDAFFTCVSLDQGEKRWRARGYGNGQVLLLADQDLLLILSERGEVSLVKADPEKHTVVGKFKAIDGKTWNHPVVAHGKLFVRNGEEVACYQLAAAGASR